MKNVLNIWSIALLFVFLIITGCSDSGGTDTITRSWGTPERISLANSLNADSPCIAFDSDGNALAAWRQYDVLSDYARITINIFDKNSGWGIPDFIEGYSAGNSSNPRIGVDSSGTVTVVWHWSSDPILNYHILSRRYTPGSGWGIVTYADAGAATNLGSCNLSVSDKGETIAVWVKNNSSVIASRYLEDTGWTLPEEISSSGQGNASLPEIAFDSNGNAITVWSQDTSPSTVNNIWANRYVAGTGWDTAKLIEMDNIYNNYSPQLAVDPEGNAIVIWQNDNVATLNLQVNTYSPGTGWGTTPYLLETEAGLTGAFDIAFDPEGNAIAIWSQDSGGVLSMFAKRYTPGTGWGSVESVENDDAGNAQYPNIAFDPAGNAIAVWQQSDGTSYNVCANIYTAGRGWGTVSILDTEDMDAQSPTITVNSNGVAMVIWTQSDGRRDCIWVSEYK